MLGAAERLWRATGTKPSKLLHLAPPHERCEQHARQVLGNVRYSALFDEGTHLIGERAITYALSDETRR